MKDSDANQTIDANNSTGDDADTNPPGSLTLTWGPCDVPAGSEDTRCMNLRLGNDTEIQVNEITNVLGAASHHFIVYRIQDEPESMEPFPCTPFEATYNPEKGVPLMVTQKAEETLTLPVGVGFTLAPNQLIRLEMHYLNATKATQAVTATSTFVPMNIADFEFEADFLFIGNPDIDIPPMDSNYVVNTDFLPLPADMEGAKIFGVTGHTHQWGSNVTVSLGTEGSMNSIYAPQNFNWDEPDTVRLSPEAVVPAGGGFQYTCTFNNQSTSQVGFGDGVADEMCFFWAYYYPSVGSKLCLHSEQAADFGITDVCCPGDQACQFLDQFL